MSEKAYLADVQVGDRLYNFLQDNREYRVFRIREGADCPIIAENDIDIVTLTRNGTELEMESTPYYLYQPVKVLDPENLPERPWRPREGEWVWARHKTASDWCLLPFIEEVNGGYMCLYDGKFKVFYHEIAPFKGELPPGLKEGDE